MKYHRSLALLAILFFVYTVSATTKRPNEIGADKIKSILQRPDNKRTTSSTVDSQLVQPLTTPASPARRLDDEEHRPSADLAEAASAAPDSEAPQVAGVRQVWTASSSGSLDELSPEIIGRLRNDVPFLAAYALRPRLVGAQTASPATTSEHPRGQLQPPSIATSGRLQTASSSPGQSLVPKLGDFSEFNVETSSTSKSEHHHRRKTSLKRKPKSLEDQREANLGLRKRLLATTSKMVKSRQMRNRPTKAKGRRSSSDKLRGRKRARGARQVTGKGNRRRLGALMKSQARTSRLRQRVASGNLKHHMNIIKHGRYYQEQSISPSANGEMDVDTRAAGDQTTSMIVGDEKEPTDTKQLDDGVKGAKRDPNKRPFYAPGKAGDTDRSSVSPAEDTADGSIENSLEGQEQPETDEGELDDGNEADLAQPKRVGDDDVEEDGDTIMVEPKSDGVDDDPEIPIGDEDEDGSPIEGKMNGEREGIDDDIASDEPRGRRMHRERPNEGGSESSSTAGGAGIGATIGGSRGVDESDGSGESGGSGGSNGSDEPGDSDGSGNSGSFGGSGGSGGSSGVGSTDEGSNDNSNGQDDRTEPDNFGARKSPSNKQPMSSVEFAGDQDGDGPDERKSGGSDDSDSAYGVSRSSGSKGRDANEDDDATSSGNPGVAGASMGTDRMDGDRGKPTRGYGDGASSDGGVGDDTSSDVDYADEMSAVAERGHGNRTNTDKHSKKHGDCDDGSYSHHDDHHHGHHNHHDSIKWLQDAIPGEPGENYPILGRVNGSNFNCRDHKHPGYYADVQSRCQIFHICQADGRQDSFLCPNGTIFSQISTVCVWWNSFDCEDAPKFYRLNALLYKQTATNSGNGHGRELRPREGTADERPPPVGSDVAGGDDDERASAMDALIGAMRRRSKPTEAEAEPTLRGAGRASNSAGSMGSSIDDEATIQRKSTNFDEASDALGGSARLRSHRREPRRKRRASVRQAPPKLRSRRVSKTARRWRLRHGIKPRRRA